MTRQELERMSREQLIAEAERLGIQRPRVLTAPELVDEIIGRTSNNERDRQRARGWLGRARDLLAKVVEKGLHLPEAARVLRQEEKSWPAPPPPLPTVTLAEIYAAQGHFERANGVLDEVLAREPEHREARSLRERFVEQAQRSRSRAGRIETPPAPPVKEAAAKEAPEKESAPKEAPAKAGKAAREEKRSETTGSTSTLTAPTSTLTTSTSTLTASTSTLTASTSTLTAPTSTLTASTSTLTASTPETTEVASGETEVVSGETEDSPAIAAAATEEEAAVEPLEEPPLPQRYEVDEVVAIAVDPRTIYLYWEVRPTTLAHARAEHPEGTLCVRIASVTASWEGPVVDTRDLHVDALYGDRFIRDVQPGSNVRVSIGWKSVAGFEPLAVGAEVTAPRAVPVEAVASETARWEEEPAPFAVAPFSAWRPEDQPEPPRHAPQVHHHAPATALPWSRPTSGELPNVVAAPVDTGVAVWGEPPAAGTGPREEITESVEVLEESWFVAGGASELSRGGPGRTRTVRVRRLIPGAPGPFLRAGGASELSRGGASEISRG